MHSRLKSPSIFFFPPLDFICLTAYRELVNQCSLPRYDCSAPFFSPNISQPFPISLIYPPSLPLFLIHRFIENYSLMTPAAADGPCETDSFIIFLSPFGLSDPLLLKLNALFLPPSFPFPPFIPTDPDPPFLQVDIRAVPSLMKIGGDPSRGEPAGIIPFPVPSSPFSCKSIVGYPSFF